MFSNRSVSVQPSAPPIEYGGDAGRLERLAPSLRSSSSVFGGSTPASSKAVTLYQTVDLLARLEEERRRACRRPCRASIHDGPKFAAIVALRKVDRLQRALLRELLHRARAAASAAMSGGLPPCDRGREDGRQRCRRPAVLDRHVRVLLLEAVEDGLERLLLVAGPDAPSTRRVPETSLAAVRRRRPRSPPPQPRRRSRDGERTAAQRARQRTASACLTLMLLSSSSSRVVDAETRLGVEEVQGARVDGDLDLARPRATRERGAEAADDDRSVPRPPRRSARRGRRRRPRASSRRLVGRAAGVASTREVDHDLGAERLAQLDPSPRSRRSGGRVGRERGVLEVLRAGCRG